MNWPYFALRLVVASAIGIAALLTIGLGSVLQTLMIGLTMSFGSQTAVLVARVLDGDTKVSIAHTMVWFALAGAAATIAIVVAPEVKGPILYLEVNELVQSPLEHLDRPRKLHGFVELMKSRTSFVVHKDGKRLQVQLRGPAPELLQDRAEIVATGRLQRQGDELVFVADEVIAKCPDTYQTPEGPRPAAEFR
jgi:cytochrome c-type biogenesis protein CcmE